MKNLCKEKIMKGFLEGFWYGWSSAMIGGVVLLIVLLFLEKA
jgi:hypothetical protein